MERADNGLAFLLQYENIAWYDTGTVKILDRRVYPSKVEFVTCNKYEDVAHAITDMVTQSAGPYTAAGMGMALAAFQAQHLNESLFDEYMQKAAYTLSHARPTTISRMESITNGCLKVAQAARSEGFAVDIAIQNHTIEKMNIRYRNIAGLARHLIDLFPEKGTVMTQCYGETIVGQMLKVARERSCEIKIICPETRPYFQGARLTASVACEMGYDVTVITDNMVAHTIQNRNVDVFTSAADAICLDGHIVNKVGTLQIAIVAKHFGIPYFVTGIPDKEHSTIDTITIEERDPEYCLQAMGIRTVMDGVKGYYPSFDITPPHLVSGVVTDCGVFSPYDIQSYY